MAGELHTELLDDLTQVLKSESNKVVDSKLPVRIHGKYLNYEPKNLPIDFAVRYFDKGEPVFIRLEPGDATRYDMLLTPLTHPSAVKICPTYGVHPVSEWAVLSLINVGGRKTTFVRLDSYFTSNWYNDELENENDFTRLAVAWFIGWFSHIRNTEHL